MQQEESSVLRSGDIQKNTVGIDKDNINFITSLLTTKLYSKPIQSFFREIVANAWDSQVEAGNADTPILISIDIRKESGTISIRDYGTGLSPERFDNIYRFIGSSTKRESNDYIGMMGIGRFVPLSLSNSCQIKSYYNGVCYSYLMYKDGNSINIDLLDKHNTEYENGLEVSVDINVTYSIIQDIIEGLRHLIYFPQLYVNVKSDYYELNSFVDNFNNREIHEYENFKINSIPVNGLMFLMGNILYNCEETCYLFKHIPKIAIKCDIGSVDVTPNREALQYSNRTKEYINKVVKKTKCELYKIVEDYINKDFDNVDEWYETKKNILTMALHKFSNDREIRLTIYQDELSLFGIKSGGTIKGIEIDNDILRNIYSQIIYKEIDNQVLKCIYTNGKFYTKNISIRYNNLPKSKVLMYVGNLTFTAKKYIVDKYSDIHEIIFIKKDCVAKFIKSIIYNIKEYCIENKKYNKVEVIKAINIIYDDLKNKFKDIETLDDSCIPKEYVDKLKKKRKAKQTKNIELRFKLISFGKFDNPDYLNKNEFDSFNIGNHYPIVYGTRDSENLQSISFIFNMMNVKRYNFAIVAKKYIHIFAKNKNCIDIDSFISQKNKILCKIFTIKYIIENDIISFYHLAMLSNIKLIDNKLIKSVLCAWREYDRVKNCADINKLYEYYKSRNWLCLDIISELKNESYKKLCNVIDNINYTGGNICDEISLNYMIYKKRIKLSDLNPIKSLKILNEYENKKFDSIRK